MKKFEIGKTYNMKSACDSSCVWEYTITARTAATITITNGKETKKCRVDKKISEYSETETVFPLGKYSMAPMLKA